ncbi:MAG: sigma-54 dependent transcriptional regulator [Pseudomonas sp.]|uniref:sigma-54-dependent transcriptional regulator n=1 Tax=Pseudomonas sp. TaxID=306 RepID=UPI0027343853|nr:sigma-54 dependent transcriptional regulator [Pseudomonas sp.]MDP3847271.1 sigma-54 dependent transcriptional regulator [Pseudomonas sp.]
MIGNSSAFQHLQHLIQRVAKTDRPVLISGPTGSGKEVAAQMVHRLGSQGLPFIDLNCGAIPENLLESELFGCAKGAFTGAASNRPGLLQMVGRGTLFLDEIGELPLSLQPKLLRVLETRAYRPLGSNENQRFDGRIIAATHRDLKLLVSQERFREDLYYRLAVLELQLPSLEQRREDIPDLIEYFCRHQPRPISFTPEALALLCRQTWPGNVRQLRNLIDRIGVLADTSRIDLLRLEPFLSQEQPAPQNHVSLAASLLQLDGEDKLAATEQLLIDHALLVCTGNKSAAALLLGVNRKVIERRLKLREDKYLALERHLSKGRALVACANFREALPILQKGLALAAEVGERKDLWRLQFELHRLLGVSLRSIEGWLSSASSASYEAALDIGRDRCNADELSTIQFGIWTAQLMSLDLVKARATAQQLLQRAQASGLAKMQTEAHVAMANTLFWLGDKEETLACLSRAGLLSEFRPAWPEAEGLDLIGLAFTLEGLAAFELGFFQRARSAMAQLIQRASARQYNAFNRLVALQGAAWLACLFEDYAQLRPLALELESLAEEYEFSFYQGVGQVFRGCYMGAEGLYDEAEEVIVEGYEKHVLRNGGRLFHSFQAWKRGEILLRAGRHHESISLVSQALDVALDHQERAYLSELMLLKASGLLLIGDHEGAESSLQNALSTALALGAVPAAISAATQLAQLLSRTKRGAQAVELLSRAVRGVAPEASHAGLNRALDLLDQLRA